MASADESYLRQVAQMYGVTDPPEVEVEKEVGPKEQVDLVVACMHELGWPEVRVQDGRISYPWTPEVQDDVGRAMYTCYARYPLRPELFEPTEEMYRQLYYYYADELVPCLRSRGLEVSSPPSWEAWIASVQVGGDYWNPVTEVDPADYPTDACPPLPPELSSE